MKEDQKQQMKNKRTNGGRQCDVSEQEASSSSAAACFFGVGALPKGLNQRQSRRHEHL